MSVQKGKGLIGKLPSFTHAEGLSVLCLTGELLQRAAARAAAQHAIAQRLQAAHTTELQHPEVQKRVLSKLVCCAEGQGLDGSAPLFHAC